MDMEKAGWGWGRGGGRVGGCNNNTNNSYMALYPVKIARARNAVHHQHQNTLDNKKKSNKKKHKYNKCTHQYQHDKKPG